MKVSSETLEDITLFDGRGNPKLKIQVGLFQDMQESAILITNAKA